MFNFPPTVCLDGAAVRRIREEKRLTQLYVAKVVGVTTDTISRWENNRYPTVRRENLFKLAEALEAPAPFLIKADPLAGECTAEEERVEVVASAAPGERTFSARFYLYLGGIGLLLGGLGFLLYRWLSPIFPGTPSPVDVTAARILPRYAAPGMIIPVRLRLNVDDATKRYIIREHFPPGWEVIEASPPASSIDNQDGMARWIVKPGEERSRIVYLVRVDARSPLGMIARFRGEIVANLDEKNQAISSVGETEMTVGPYNWSDLDGDSSIDDAEMLEASLAFEELEGVHLDWKDLERLWDAGHYRFDPVGRRFVPEKSEYKDIPKK
ncbi:MAG: helix-turn-helix transcriptional regulator [Desulfuromonadales bacterium]|nr:helix-turn-helix transcriptional regulator [Desulfuromonadales bacterium]